MSIFSGLPTFGELLRMAGNNTNRNLAGIAAAWTSAGVVTACCIAGLLWAIMTLYAYPSQEGIELQATVKTLADYAAKSEQRLEALIISQQENAFQIRLWVDRMGRLHPIYE